MFINKLSIDDYQEILDHIKGDCKFSIIYFCLKSSLNGWSPTTKVHAWKLYNDSYTAYGVLNILQYGKPYFHMEGNVYDIEKCKEAAKCLFNEIYPLLKDEEDFCLACPNEFIITLRELFIQSTPFIHTPLEDYGILFCIDDKDYESYICKEITVPEKYYIDKLSSEDSEMMLSVYQFRDRDDNKRVGNRINEFPSVCVKEKKTDKIVSFMYNDGFGFLSHQYTFPEYRKQGLGTISEMYLSRLNKELLGVMPLKGVSTCRKYVLEYTRKSGYWKRLPSNKLTDSDICWTVFSKKKVDKLIVTDV
uniref:Glycine N-acyltransferase-like protein n=1 Tax=Strongyloides papillosus TaxID=174720 RepID=A0A0N5B2Q4_STREA